MSKKQLMYGNLARPTTIFQLWIACHRRLVTKGRLYNWGMIDNIACCFCDAEESQQHLLFECVETRTIWKNVLEWIQVDHEPLGWEQEIDWLVNMCKGKSRKAAILKFAAMECVYEVWRYINDKFFGNSIQNRKIEGVIIDMIVYRSWFHRKTREYLAILIS